jgi:hypothetical protein
MGLLDALSITGLREVSHEVGEPGKHKAHMHTYMMTIEDDNINPNDVISFLTGPECDLIFRVMSSDGHSINE